jgi:hypothetical protein
LNEKIGRKVLRLRHLLQGSIDVAANHRTEAEDDEGDPAGSGSRAKRRQATGCSTETSLPFLAV